MAGPDVSLHSIGAAAWPRVRGGRSPASRGAQRRVCRASAVPAWCNWNGLGSEGQRHGLGQFQRIGARLIDEQRDAARQSGATLASARYSPKSAFSPFGHLPSGPLNEGNMGGIMPGSLR